MANVYVNRIGQIYSAAAPRVTDDSQIAVPSPTLQTAATTYANSSVQSMNDKIVVAVAKAGAAGKTTVTAKTDFSSTV